jgi:hypothetical protein
MYLLSADLDPRPDRVGADAWELLHRRRGPNRPTLIRLIEV